MIDKIIKILLIALIIFTPLAFGSMEIWAFSLMELGILLIIILWALQTGIVRFLPSKKSADSAIDDPDLSGPGREAQSPVPFVLLALFLLLILFQTISLPSGVLKILSPKTFALRSALSLGPSASSFPISFFL